MFAHNLIPFLVLSLFCLLSGCQPTPPAATPPAATPSAPAPTAARRAWLDMATEEQIDAIVEQAMTVAPVPGLEMCIVKEGEVVFSRAYGLSDVESERDATPRSVMIQASVSKPLTAMAVMRLAEEGRIELDAPVTTYLPYFTMADPAYEQITVRMLLAHRSGIPDSPAIWEEPLDPAMSPLEQAVRDLEDSWLAAAPGEAWVYSGFGYSVLGAMIEEVTGSPFVQYMQDEWLTPLGMRDSTFAADQVDPALIATLYVTGEDGAALEKESDCDARDGPACMLYSNCDDMAKWAILALNRGEAGAVRFLQSDSFETMWATASETGWPYMFGPWYGQPLAGYGLGWAVGDLQGHRLAGHNGAISGANAFVGVAPDDGLAVVAMANWNDFAEDGALPATVTAIDVLYLLLGYEQ